jgi:alanine dehydrogenase
MKKIHIGIIREGKTPPDERVPLSPEQCRVLKNKFPDVDITVQPSEIRCFDDSEYEKRGIRVDENIADCDILMGVKEVPIDQLIPEKTYLFFSHTFKKQPYNRNLMRALMDKKIRLVDYELLKDIKGRRLIGFGRYAGVVGAYNALLAYGKKSNRYELKPANQCEDRKEVDQELKKVSLPRGFRIVLTGKGRVAGGAMEILNAVGIPAVTPSDFIETKYDQAVYTQLGVDHYNRKKDGSNFDKAEFYNHPERFDSNFMTYAEDTDMYIACHYWDSKAPFIFTREDARDPRFGIRIVADISCDIDGPVASTLRPSKIADPLYGYDPYLEAEVDFMAPNAIGVMAVDNLPCELPKDASEDFGTELLNNVFPHLLGNDSEEVILRATETNHSGELTSGFSYLQDWVDGVE